MNKAFGRGLAVLAVAFAAPACHRAAQTPPLAGARIGGPIALVDQDGHAFGERQLAGKWRLVYFGYTSCPDVCPLDVQNLARGLKLFEARDAAAAAKVQPLFVTVDPARDTPAVLKQFVTAFHPRLVGLTGSEAAIAETAKRYAIMFRRQPPAPGAQGYLVDHSRTAILFDPSGAPIALVPQDEGGEAVAAELAKWVS